MVFSLVIYFSQEKCQNTSHFQSYAKIKNYSIFYYFHIIQGDSLNYMQPILVPSSAKRIATYCTIKWKIRSCFERLRLRYNPAQ